MGYLTTVTLYNDDADNLKRHADDLAETLHNACCGIKKGASLHSLIVQKPRHADDHTLYLHAGNTVTDVYNAESEWMIKTFIQQMEYHLERLKKLQVVIELDQVQWMNNKLIVNWEKIPEEYNWVAACSDGEVQAFENKPDLVPTRIPACPFTWKNFKGDTPEFIGELDINIEHPEETLQQRPS